MICTMANLIRRVIFPFIFFWVIAAPAAVEVDELFFQGFHGANRNFSLSGVAEIERNGILELTNETNKVMGRAFYSSPLRFKNSTDGPVFSFSTSFAFVIVPEFRTLGGHGLTFAVAPSTDFSSALARQYFGLFNNSNLGNLTNHIFAVEFDTVQDVEFGDIDDNHIGIDINTLHSSAVVPAAYFADDNTRQNLTLKIAKKIMVWIDYDSATNDINVTVSLSSSKPKSSILSYNMNLTPIFHETMYVGFSASTGLLASGHYISGWSFKMNGEPKSLNLKSLPSVPGGKKNRTALVIGLSVLAVVFVIASISIAFYLIRRHKNADVIEAWELEIGPHRYSYQELHRATKGFKESELLGSGGFGRVYRGTLPNSKIQVAVKRIAHDSKQGFREFVSEIASIGLLRHRNLVQLLGWCRRRGDLLLVYDYMPNGSLDKFLFDHPNMILSWERRFKIIKGVASVLVYLHDGYEKAVIHRDIKSSNVLLDSDLNGKLGDFGLARLHENGSNPNTTRVVGTLGYLAPELPKTARATTKSDVFAFGALLLEVVCGRRPIEANAEPEKVVLVDWVWSKWKEGTALDVVDPKLIGEFDENEVVLVLKLGLMCSNDDPQGRPAMQQIVRYLEGEISMMEVLRPPFEEKKNVEGIENYLLSFGSSSSFSKKSTSGLLGNEGGGDSTVVTSASLSTSPFSLLYDRGNGGR